MLVGLAEGRKTIPPLPVSPKAEGVQVHLAVALAKAEGCYPVSPKAEKLFPPCLSHQRRIDSYYSPLEGGWGVLVGLAEGGGCWKTHLSFPRKRESSKTEL